MSHPHSAPAVTAFDETASGDPRRPTILLTGATGFLGRYLLRDLSAKGVSLALLVRPSRRADAETRVGGMLRFWKQRAGVDIPRPKVLSGDILTEHLGLSSDDRDWMAENVGSVLHNAASLSFVSTGRHAEPWRSNIDGTQIVLNACADAGIRNFHHVSTAYVAGKRRELIREVETNVGQEFGNCYEESKLMAEELVRGRLQDGLLDQLTVHRPAIIIGDSRDGFVSTFHHVYSALQMAYVMADSMGRWDHTGRMNAANVRIPMTGQEHKNLVPVDWVSEAMSRIVADPALHGQTYHLTPRASIEMRVLRDMIEESIGYYGIRLEIPEPGSPPKSEAEALFMQQQEVYESYWNDDPVFDSSNVRAALPDLPCPHVDRSMMLRMAETAIEMNFRFNDPRPEKATRAVAEAVRS